MGSHGREDPRGPRRPGALIITSGLRRLSLAVCIGLGTLAAPGVARELPPLECSLDLTTGKFVPGGFGFMLGWAADRSLGAPVAKMEVLLDGSIHGDVELSGHRPDVAKAVGRPDYRWSGWVATVSLEGVNPGSHRIEVFAYSRPGGRVSCGIGDLTVRPSPWQPRPDR